MFEQWTIAFFPKAKFPYEHAGCDYSPAFIAAAFRSGDRDSMTCWLGHGQL